MTDKESTFFFPLPKHPKMVLIDPHDAVLKEITQDKGRDLWVAQLLEAPYATSRIRAAKQLGESGKDRDVELLSKALQSEAFWGVGVEIAKALGKAGGDKARDALLAGLELKHPKVRRACADELSSFRDDEKAISALYSLIQKGDPSYLVEAAAIESYGKIQPEGAVPFLTSLLDRDSHRERIRSAALRAMGEQEDAAGLAILIEWTGRGKPRSCRTAAISALGTLADSANLSDEDLSQVVNAIAASIKGERRWLKATAIRTLGKLGEAARKALPVLRDVAANDPRGRSRKRAEEAIDKITAASPPMVQVDDLRDQLDKLRDENEALKERLAKLEARDQQTLSGHDN